MTAELDTKQAREGQQEMPARKLETPARKRRRSKVSMLWQRLVNRYRPERRYMRG